MSDTAKTFEEWLSIVEGEYPEVRLTRAKNLLRQAWNAALEEAALVCDDDGDCPAGYVGDVIRKLKGTTE